MTRDWIVESQVCKPWRLLIEAGCFQTKAETGFPSIHLLHPSLLQKPPLASEAPRTSTLLQPCNQLVLRLTLQSQTIDAVTYLPSHTADYSVYQFTVLLVEVKGREGGGVAGWGGLPSELMWGYDKLLQPPGTDRLSLVFIFFRFFLFVFLKITLNSEHRDSYITHNMSVNVF